MTIKDIARLCGVSVSTVSRALNNRPDVSRELRQKILRYNISGLHAWPMAGYSSET